MEMASALLAPGWDLTPMPVRFDDQYLTHREVAGLSDAAFRLHTAAIFWCEWNDTDGFIPEEDLDLVCAQVRDPARFAAECVRRGAWHMADKACATADCPEPRAAPGWVIHDFRIYPASDGTEVTEKKSSGGKWGNHKRWHEGRKVQVPGCRWCEAAPPSESESDTDRSPIRSATSVSDRRPNPSRSKSKSSTDKDQSTRARDMARLADAITRPEDDDDVLSAVIKTTKNKTGLVLHAPAARRIAKDILAKARDSVPNPVKYVTAAIERERDPIRRWSIKPEEFQAPMPMAVPSAAAEADPGRPPPAPDIAERGAAEARRRLGLLSGGQADEEAS